MFDGPFTIHDSWLSLLSNHTTLETLILNGRSHGLDYGEPDVWSEEYVELLCGIISKLIHELPNLTSLELDQGQLSTGSLMTTKFNLPQLQTLTLRGVDEVIPDMTQCTSLTRLLIDWVLSSNQDEIFKSLLVNFGAAPSDNNDTISMTSKGPIHFRQLQRLQFNGCDGMKIYPLSRPFPGMLPSLRALIVHDFSICINYLHDILLVSKLSAVCYLSVHN
jgi:hypothetical protein